MNLKEYIKNNHLILDGAMGTYFSEKYPEFTDPCETANIANPEYVLSIHRDYIEAGSNAIKTNTFSVNPLNEAFLGDRFRETIEAGCRLACQAAGEADRDIHVFADIGPITGADPDEAAEALIRMCDVYLDEGMHNFIFETNSNPYGIVEAAEKIRDRVPDAFILVSFAVLPDGYTREGYYYLDLLNRMKECDAIDGFGLNCILSAMHMRELLERVDFSDSIVCVLPNGGYPRVAGRRIFYTGDPGFFCDEVEKMAQAGASVLGGCCGTRPEFIRQIAERLSGTRRIPKVRPQSAAHQKEEGDPLLSDNRFWSKLEAGKKVIAVEFDTPRKDSGDTFMSGAWKLKAAGVDAITLADCPTARPSMDSSLMACKIRRELNLDTIPHMTCRDRNINATKALLLGLSMEEVRNVLIVTGDPIPSAERDEVKSVFQFNSRMLAGYVNSLNRNEMTHPFRIYGALNLNARRFDQQIRFAKEKIENGVSGFLTQPVLTEQALDNLRLAHRELDAKILGGIIPVVSSRNGRFMNSEISGITVDEKVIEMYEGKTREECTELAVTISSEIASRIDPYVDGFYLMTPFGRVDIMERIIKNIRSMYE